MNWGYVSGFFDADGYVTFVKHHANEEKSPCIGFTNNEIDILNKIREFIYAELGITGSIAGKMSALSTTKNYDLKYIHVPKILLLASKIISYHPKKIHRLSLITTKLLSLTPRNGKYNKDLLLGRKQFEQEFFSRA